MMIAIEITRPGPPEVLRPGKRPVPTPGDGEVLIKVEAAGVNRPDLMQRRGLYPPPPGASDLPGLEVSGRIAALGASVAGLAIGDAVCALLAGGGYAEFAVAPAVQCLPVPAGLSMVEAAALPETLFTCWTNLVDSGRLKAGETVLIHGGSSGIGTTGIQLAKALGAKVLVTAGTPEKCAACLRLGADLAIDYRQSDFVLEVKAATGGRGVDVVLDMVGGDYVRRNIEAMAPLGRHVSIAVQAGGDATIPIFRIMQKRLILTGSTLRARSAVEKGAIAKAIEQHAWQWVETGKIRPVVHRTFPLAQAGDAHAALEAGDHIGKIVLTVV
jgi:putative PIG3 family NAD(P)H quinone oxidoreductase